MKCSGAPKAGSILIFFKLRNKASLDCSRFPALLYVFFVLPGLISKLRLESGDPRNPKFCFLKLTLRNCIDACASIIEGRFNDRTICISMPSPCSFRFSHCVCEPCNRRSVVSNTIIHRRMKLSSFFDHGIFRDTKLFIYALIRGIR